MEKQYCLKKKCLNCQHWQQKTLEKIIGHYNNDKRHPKIGYEQMWKCELNKSYYAHNCCENFLLSDYMKKQIKIIAGEDEVVLI